MQVHENENKNERERVLARTISRFRERKILLPTFAQMRDPHSVPQTVKNRLKDVGLWDVDPANLFRITWKNEPVAKGGQFNQGNWIEKNEKRLYILGNARLDPKSNRFHHCRVG